MFFLFMPNCKVSKINAKFGKKLGPWESKIFAKIALSRTVSKIKVCFAFYAEIQDGLRKWRENDFCGKSPVHTANTPWVGKRFFGKIGT